jgi:hypothetical protein
LVVRLQDKLSQPLNGINSKLQAFGSRVTALAGAAGIAAVATALGNFVKKGFEAADALGDAADRAGIAVESLSRLKFVADQNDVEFSSLTVALKRYQVTLSQAASGSKESADALGLIGLKAAQLKNLRLEDQLRIIADQFRRIKDPADQTRVAVELFGRSGEQLVPLLRQGGAAIGALTAEADRLGITLDGKAVRSIDAADKALKKLKATVDSFGSRIAGNIALAIVGPADELDAATLKLEKLQEQLRQLTRDAIEGNFSQELEDRRRAEINKAISDQTKVIEDLKRRAQEDASKDPLVIPVEFQPIGEVRIGARRKNVEGLDKLLNDFDESTKGALESARANLEATRLKLQELFENGRISAEQFAERMKNAQIAFEDAVTIEPVETSVKKVIPALTRQQEAVKGFVDTMKTGLANLAMSGELTGKSILKYLLSALTSKVLMNAIDALGSALTKALTKSTSGAGGKGGGWGAFLGGILSAFSAGGGRTSGPRIVGEEGPELLLSNGMVMNRRQLAFATAGAGAAPNITMGDTTIVIQGNADARTVQMMEARLAANNKKLTEEWNRRLKDSFGRGLR